MQLSELTEKHMLEQEAWIAAKTALEQHVGDKAVNAEARATLCDDEEPVCERMQDRHREREIGTKKRYIPNSNDYKITTTTSKRLQSHFI